MNKLMFIGQDGSMGLKKGHIYRIWAIHIDKHVQINVETDEGVLYIPYKNLTKLGQNWDFIKE